MLKRLALKFVESGNTFSHTLVNVSVFLLVVMVMLFGFAVLFNLMYSITAMTSFDALLPSMFSLFRGLLGDIVSCKLARGNSLARFTGC